MLERIAKPLSQALFLGAGLGMITLLYVGAFHAHPAWDDFCVGWYSLEYSALDAAYIRYMGVSGKFTAYLWMGYFFKYIGAVAGRELASVFFITASLSACIYMTTSLMPLVKSRRLLVASGTALFAVYAMYLRLTMGAFYWETGGFVYQMGVVFWWLLIGGLVRVSLKTPKYPLLAKLGIAVFAFFTVGHAETIMAMTIATLIPLTASLYVAKAAARHYWGFAAVGAIAGAALMFASPANSTRITYFEGSESIVNTIRITLTGGAMFLSLGLAALFTLHSLIPFRAERDRILAAIVAQFSAFPSYIVASWALLYCALPFVLFVPIGWTLGTLGPERAKLIFYGVWIAGWFPFIAAITHLWDSDAFGLAAWITGIVDRLQAKSIGFSLIVWLGLTAVLTLVLLMTVRPFNVRTLNIPTLIIVIAALTLFPSLRLGQTLLGPLAPNMLHNAFAVSGSYSSMVILMLFFLSFSNLSLFAQDYFDGTMGRFDAHIEARYEAVDAALASGDTNLVVPALPLNARPELTIMHGDITTATKGWVNGCTAAYLGLESITAVE